MKTTHMKLFRALNHEARTALTVIIGNTDFLITSKISQAEREKYIRDIKDASLSFLNFLNQIFKINQAKKTKLRENKIINNSKMISNKSNVLVVDDDRLVQKLHSNLLIELGYNVDVANNGKEALNLLNHRKYVAILTDIEMPQLSGTEMSEIIRDNKSKYKQIPIIAVTSDVTERKKNICAAVGINRVIVKPLADKNYLKLLLVKLLGKSSCIDTVS